jgi:Uncharacterized protein conserved in bacteria (DUF2219)
VRRWATTYRVFTVTVDVHPASTQFTIPDPRDRRYGGLLLGNLSLLSDTDRSRSVLMLIIGLVGPGAGAKDLQNGFHSLIGQQVVKDWNSQIPDTPATELLSGRTWRLHIAEFGALETDALSSLTAPVGDVRDYAQVGVTFRTSQGLNSDFGVSRPRPGLSGEDAYVQTRPGMSSGAWTARWSHTTCCCKVAHSGPARALIRYGTWAKRKPGSPSSPMACTSPSPTRRKRRNSSGSMAACISSARLPYR